MSSVVSHDDLILNNDIEMPAIGLGVFQTPPDETRAAVAAALRTGYRHIDTAAAYGNEREVGEAVAASGVDRDEIFVETKIWISDYGYEETLHGFEKSAGKLGLERIDLLILHQALPSAFDRTLEAYRALERPCWSRAGSAPSASATSWSSTSPSCWSAPRSCRLVNQIEVHPYSSSNARCRPSAPSTAS